jgi:hypothetical protein
MTRWAMIFMAMLMASFPGVASARANCEAIPRGPERIDCYLALSQFYRAQSDLAAAKAFQADAAWYRAASSAIKVRQEHRSDIGYVPQTSRPFIRMTDLISVRGDWMIGALGIEARIRD